MKEIIIDNIDAGQRFDKYLSKLLPEAGKSFIYKMLRKKNIVLNNKKCDGSEKIANGDIIKIFFSDETFDKFSHSVKTPQDKNYDNIIKNKIKTLDIVYEDDNIVIVNKPSGVLSQKAKPDDISINEIIGSYIMSDFDKKEQSFKPGICNRLDRNTSGIVVAGKNIHGLQTMSAAFHDRTIYKYYICIVKGVFTKRQCLNGFIKKDEAGNIVTILSEDEFNKMAPSDRNNYSPVNTEFIPVAHGNDISLVKVHLITGKTHQIRAHLRHIGYPIAGDYKYGSSSFNDYMKKNYQIKDQMLHAYELIIPVKAYPDLNDDLHITTCIPDEFVRVLKGENIWQPGIQEVLGALH